jgi:4,5-DOPA dioxygenase extradiol
MSAELATGRMPAIYLSHGAPPLADDALWTEQLAGWAKALPRPTSVLMDPPRSWKAGSRGLL